MNDRPEILFEEDSLLAVYKPAGIHVFGRDSMASWLVAQRPDLSGVGPESQPAFVHRIDRGTSGLILAAKSALAWERLRDGFRRGVFVKYYLALVEGTPRPERDLIDLPLGSRRRRSRRVHVASGRERLRGVRPARTRYQLLGSVAGASSLILSICTGHRHQIRAHLAHIGHPILGDALYGASQPHTRFFLHAWRISGRHPLRDGSLGLCCPLPDDLMDWASRVGLSGLDVSASQEYPEALGGGSCITG